MPIATVDPSSGQTLRSFEELTEAEVEQRLSLASAAASVQAALSFDQRAGLVRRAADLLEQETSEVALLMTTEMGKTLTAAELEVGKCVGGLRFYAEHAEAMLAEQGADAAAVKASAAAVRWQPLGVVLAVMPWNFPLWQVIRFAAPALMAGNVGLLKHASNVPQTALYLEELFLRAGFERGAFQSLLIDSDKVEALLKDPRVAAATLTGSTPAGRAVAATAGSVLKPVVLELGGSDPFVVMPSADLARAAEVAAIARCQNNGQSCIAAKRFIIHTDVYDEWVGLFRSQLAELVMGDPKERSTTLGPLATEQGRSDVHELVRDAVDQGAELLLGGDVPEGSGWFYPATLLAGVTPAMRMFREEVFGPVAQVHRVSGLDQAIELANDTEFGLGSAIWTTDEAESDAFVDRVQAGMVFVNGMTTSYAELPFGGIGSSGFGRELSDLGLKAFCNAKTVWVA